MVPGTILVFMKKTKQNSLMRRLYTRKTIRWCILALFGICALFAACENPWVKNITDGLFKDKYISISSATGLAAIANNLSGNYKLTADIKLGGYGPWTRIGDLTIPFTGTLDGGGHTIDGLNIPGATTDNQGLFGVVGTAGVVKSLGLTNVSINSTNPFVGGVVGDNYGTKKTAMLQAVVFRVVQLLVG